MSGMYELRDKYKEAFEKAHGTKLGFMSIFLKASAAALQEIPAINAVIDGSDVSRAPPPVGPAAATTPHAPHCRHHPRSSPFPSFRP